MKIDKKSWHFRLYSVYVPDELNIDTNIDSINLCSYVRGVFRGCLVALALIVVGWLVAVVLLEPVFTLISYLITGVYIGGFFIPGSHFLLFINVIIYSIIAIIATWYFIGNYIEYLKNTNVYTSKVDDETSFLNIINVYFKAKHNKYCPVIEVIETKIKKAE